MRKLRNLIVGMAASGSLLLGGQAMAADLFVAPSPVDYFSGFYGGVHGGWGWSNASSAYENEDFNPDGFFGCGESSLFGCAVDVDPEGGFIGFQAGYNFRMGDSFILGIEGDYSFASLQDDGLGSFLFGGGTSATEVILEIDRMASIRARLGWDMGQMMPYITGGYGWMHADRSAFNPDTLCGVAPNCKTTDSNWHGGFVVGGGLEYAITENWRVKGEYRYWGGSTENYGLAFGEGTNVDLSVHTVQFGVNYGF